MDPAPAPGKQYAFGIEDCAASVENMLLAITALGYGTVWTDGALRRLGVAGEIGQLLGVPDHLQVKVLLPLGVPAKNVSQREKKPFRERAFWNRYGSGE
jgi:nitroreductase